MKLVVETFLEHILRVLLVVFIGHCEYDDFCLVLYLWETIEVAISDRASKNGCVFTWGWSWHVAALRQGAEGIPPWTGFCANSMGSPTTPPLP